MSAELGLDEIERGALTGFTRRIALALAELRDAWDIATERELIEAAIFTIMSHSIFRIPHHRDLMKRVLSHGFDDQIAVRFTSKVIPKGRTHG